jgi:c-di-GMP-binding flagellar brake protein YcgR
MMIEFILGGIIISTKEKVIERRLSQRISQQLMLTIRPHAGGPEIQNAAIENISIGGMQFSVPADTAKLKIYDTCSFIFDLPQFGKCYILGEIRYCRVFSDPSQRPAIHYGVKFIKLSMKIWHHILRCCQNETNPPGKRAVQEPEILSKASMDDETLTARTFELIKVQIQLEKGGELNGTVKDINYGGLKLLLSEAMPVNTNLFMRISFMEHTVTANGNCNWSDRIGDEGNLFLANISFTDIQQQQFDNLQALMMKLAAHMADSIRKSL